MDEKIHQYRGEDIDVTWDQHRCIHAADCVRGLPAVFDTDRRPWVDPDEAAVDAVADVVTCCPTGALQFERHDGSSEPIPDTNTVSIAPDGPLYLRGDVELQDSANEVLLRDIRMALCRCGASGNKPLCDGAHADVDFADDGTVSAADATDDHDETGPMTVMAAHDGPLFFEGPLQLRSGTGDAHERDDAVLCRCGASKNKPFCDGMHKKTGFAPDSDSASTDETDAETGDD